MAGEPFFFGEQVASHEPSIGARVSTRRNVRRSDGQPDPLEAFETADVPAD
jgi:hypothetical protein